MSLKLTASLLQSYGWLKECPPSYKGSAKQGIVNALNKVPFTNAAVERGQRYEDIVNKALKEGTPLPKELECLVGSKQQEWIKPLDIDGYVFRGRLDYLQLNHIYDLKTTKKLYTGAYANKWQHVIYALAQKVENFTYLVAVFEGDKSVEPSEIATIPFKIEAEYDRKRLSKEIAEFIEWLKREALYDAYIQVYNVR